MTTPLPFTKTTPAQTADALNRHGVCNTLDMQRLQTNLESAASLQGLLDNIMHTRPHLFSGSMVFVSEAIHRQITDVVAAVERIAALPCYQDLALSHATPVARHAWGPRGACMGYDFHISKNGAQLIEINTNAGGLMLNVALASAHNACGHPLNLSAKDNGESFPSSLMDMFTAEWHLQRGESPWGHVLIPSTLRRNFSFFASYLPNMVWMLTLPPPTNFNGKTANCSIAIGKWRWSITV